MAEYCSFRKLAEAEKIVFMNIIFCRAKFYGEEPHFNFQQSESETLTHVYKQRKLNFRKSHDFQ